MKYKTKDVSNGNPIMSKNSVSYEKSVTKIDGVYKEEDIIPFGKDSSLKDIQKEMIDNARIEFNKILGKIDNE